MRFGALRMPLAMLELPLFILIPSFYHQRGVPLEIVGVALLAIRGLDAVFDPWVGQYMDRSKHSYRHWIYISLPFAALGFAACFLPFGAPLFDTDLKPSTFALVAWMLGSSLLTYLSYSVLSIAYQAWGAQLGKTEADKARVTGWREAQGLLGVMLAASMMSPEASVLT